MKISLETRRKLSEAQKGHKVLKETREKISRAKKGKPGPKQSAETIRKRVESLKDYRHSEETKKKIGMGNRGKVRSQRTRTILSIINAGSNHPNYGKPHSEETREKISKANKGQISHNKGKKFSQETRDKIGLAVKKRLEDPRNNPNWRGGISAEPYCDVWKDKEYKEDIKKRDGNRCQNPDCVNIMDLMIHHIDYVKKNCYPLNLITLCRGCNTRANYNKEYWRILYQSIVYKREVKVA